MRWDDKLRASSICYLYDYSYFLPHQIANMCSFTPSLHSTPMTTGNSSHKRKAVSFSQVAKLRRVIVANDSKLLAYSSWLTDDEVSSSKKRARNLSKVHYLKTRHDAYICPNDRSGIVYNCHPAHYEIIGESLRGMEHITDASTSQKRIRLRSNTVSLIQQFQNQDPAYSFHLHVAVVDPISHQ